MNRELELIYKMVLKYRNRARINKKRKYRDRALAIALSSGKARNYIEIIIGGSKRRKYRLLVP